MACPEKITAATRNNLRNNDYGTFEVGSIHRIAHVVIEHDLDDGGANSSALRSTCWQTTPTVATRKTRRTTRCSSGSDDCFRLECNDGTDAGIRELNWFPTAVHGTRFLMVDRAPGATLPPRRGRLTLRASSPIAGRWLTAVERLGRRRLPAHRAVRQPAWRDSALGWLQRRSGAVLDGLRVRPCGVLGCGWRPHRRPEVTDERLDLRRHGSHRASQPLPTPLGQLRRRHGAVGCDGGHLHQPARRLPRRQAASRPSSRPSISDTRPARPTSGVRRRSS